MVMSVGRSNYEIAELTWENGQFGMNGLSGLVQTSRPAVWDGRASETLECVVNQATGQVSSGEKWAEIPYGRPAAAALVKKRTRSESNCGSIGVEGSNCMEVSGRERESESHNTMSMSWANSFDSSTGSKNKSTFDNSASRGGSEKRDDDGETKTETVRSGSSRRSRAAAVHNQSERRRRDRINQKMKTLQKLVPNASKTDKASMLDEVIEYLKQLQAQVQLMSNCNNSRMNMNMNMNMMMQQYQLQLSLLLSRMGNCNSTTTTPFLLPPPPPFLLPSSIIQPHPSNQSMDMEMYKKMAEVYLQQNTHGTTNQ